MEDYNEDEINPFEYSDDADCPCCAARLFITMNIADEEDEIECPLCGCNLVVQHVQYLVLSPAY